MAKITPKIHNHIRFQGKRFNGQFFFSFQQQKRNNFLEMFQTFLQVYWNVQQGSSEKVFSFSIAFYFFQWPGNSWQLHVNSAFT